jgi:hypothetical protein
MEFDAIFARTPASMEEIEVRVGYALERHPLCRDVQFDIVRMPSISKGN